MLLMFARFDGKILSYIWIVFFELAEQAFIERSRRCEFAQSSWSFL
jgi:hypothetical protein